MKIASTSDVLDRHMKSFAERDLDGVVADYSSDAVLFVPGGPLKGPDAIKPFLRPSFRSFRSRVPRLRCSCDALRGITPTSSGLQKQQTIRTNSLPTRLLCGTGK